MNRVRLRPALGITLLASLAAAAGLALHDEPGEALAQMRDVVPAVRPAVVGAAPSTGPGPTPGSAQAPGTGPVPGLPARPADWPAADPSALRAWGAPPPPVAAAPAPPPRPAAEPPPPPRAPAFPYQWIGSLDDGAGRQALLGGRLRAAALREGQVLDGQWRLDHLRDEQLELTWLPAGLRVSVRAASPASRGGPAPVTDTQDSAPDS